MFWRTGSPLKTRTVQNNARTDSTAPGNALASEKPAVIASSPSPSFSTLPDVRLKGFRVTLRPPSEEDWRQWARVRKRNATRLQQLEPRWASDALSRDFYRRRLQRQLRDWQMGLAYPFLIFKNAGLNNDSPSLIGGVNLNHVCGGAARHAMLGYWLDEAHEGQGLMSESLRLAVAYAFNALGLERLNAACLSENRRSRALLVRLGFEQEGFAKKYLQINGIRRDHVLYGLNRPDKV